MDLQSIVWNTSRNFLHKSGQLPEVPVIGLVEVIMKNLFVFNLDTDIALEWAVVRAHPDDPDLILLVPLDDAPFVGTADVVLPVDRLLIARCGESDWFDLSVLSRGVCLGEVPVQPIRQRLAELVRGRIVQSRPAIDADPEYEQLLRDIQRAREELSGPGRI